jgi:hypothetical protein
MKPIKCFTSFTFSYLGRATILAETLKAAHPDWEIYGLMVDEPPPGLDVGVALRFFDRVVYAKDLGIPRWKAWLFKHDIVEASTAVKGRMARYLLSLGASHVVYLDPDIAVFHPLDRIIEKLEDHSVILTPHQVAPNSRLGYIRDNELAALKYGIFNLGFVAINNDDTGHAFADWWDARTYEACYDEVETGIFTDQKWCDLVPALFPRVYIERDPSFNVASWNLSTRTIRFSESGQITVNNLPLKFYHFTKVNGVGDFMTEKYAADNIEALEIWNWYKRALIVHANPSIPKNYWAFGTFDNGVKIPKSARVLFRGRSDLYDRFEDPYQAGSGSYFEWMTNNAPSIVNDVGSKGFEPV